MHLPSDPGTVSERHSAFRRRGRRLVIVGIILITAIALTWGVQRWWTARIDWKPVLAWNPAISMDACELVRDWGAPGIAVSLPAGAPYRLEPGQWLLISTVREPDDVRVTIDAEWLDRIDGIELMIRADAEPGTAAWMVPRSINCQFGGFSGVESSLSINRTPGAPGRQAIVPASFVKGHRHLFTLESFNGLSRTMVDGRTLLELPELAPLGNNAADRVAIRAWAPILIHGIHVERVRQGEQVSTLRVGDCLAAHGEIPAAIDWYRRVAIDHPQSELAALAWAKIGACAADRADPGSDLQEALNRLAKDFPGHPLHDQVEEIDVLYRWRTRDYPGALTALEAICARRPDSHLPVRLNAERPGIIPAEYVRRLVDLLLQVPGLTQVDLHDLGLSDIGFLAGRHLTDLNLSGNPVADIHPLEGLPLQRLNLSGTRVTDLAPLHGMPLRILTLYGSPVTDLGPLTGMHLEEVELSGTRVADLSPLRGQPLVRFEAADSLVTSLEPLAGMSLISVSVDHAPIRDLAPLQGMPLQMLNLTACPISDLAPLAKSVGLKNLYLARTKVINIDALTGLPIEMLDLDDLQIDQLNAVRGMPIQDLSIAHTRVANLDPLQGSSLKVLRADGAPIASLLPLARVPLEYLDIGDAPALDLVDVAPIVTLRYLGTGFAANPQGRLAAANLLMKLGRPDLAQMVTAAALSSSDPKQLQAVAGNIGGHQRLMIGRDMTWEAAAELAQAADAMLVCPRDPEDLRAIFKTVVVSSAINSDLIYADGTTRLPDGTPVTDLAPAGPFSPGAPIHLYWSGGGQGCAWSGPADEKEPMVMLEWPRVTAKK